MFKKKPTVGSAISLAVRVLLLQIKPFAPLKSSDRRKIADAIIAQHHIQVPVDENANPDDKAVNPHLTALRRSLLPENALSARFTTTRGADSRQMSGMLYAGGREDEEQRVLWVKFDDKLFPSVYTLWRNPGIVPLLHTTLAVVEKLQSGADLMTPGLQMGPPFPKHATKDAIVAVASIEAPTVPMAVGTCEINVSALGRVQGAKGQAVRSFHWAGDELWAWSPIGRPGTDPPTAIGGWGADEEDVELVSRAEALDMAAGEEDDGGVLVDAPPSRKADAEGARATGAPSTELAEQVEDKELSTKGMPSSPSASPLTAAEIDDAFRDAFLYGVRYHVDHNKDQPSYGLEFPISQSNVMSLLVQPFLPTYTPARTASLQLKKTSWKNIRKFIKFLDKQQIIKSKDRDGHEAVVLDIEFGHELIQDFRPYKLPKKDTPASGGGKPAAPLSSDPAVGQKLTVLSLLRPKEKFAAVFKAAEADPQGWYTAAELRPVLNAWVATEKMVVPSNKRLVTVNPLIANGVLGSSAADVQIVADGTIPRDILAERFAAACSPFHAILRNDATLADSKPKAGLAPPVHITLETRSGHKTVTKISGLEAYHVSPQPLADELRKRCAGSTSVERLNGSSPKNPVMEVMVQGPQKETCAEGARGSRRAPQLGRCGRQDQGQEEVGV